MTKINMKRAEPVPSGDPPARAHADQGHRWARWGCRAAAAGRPPGTQRILLDGGQLGSVFVFLSTSSISTFPPLTPTPGGTRAAGILFSACSHGGALGEFCFFQLKKRKFSKHTHISRNQWQLKK